MRPGLNPEGFRFAEGCSAVRYKILIIDPDPNSFEPIQRPLAAAGHEVFVATDAGQGADTFGELEPDVTFVEALLPTRNGVQLCSALKSSGQNSKGAVVLVNGGALTDDAAEGIPSCGCDGRLEKPIDDEILLGMCDQLVAANAGAEKKVLNENDLGAALGQLNILVDDSAEKDDETSAEESAAGDFSHIQAELQEFDKAAGLSLEATSVSQGSIDATSAEESEGLTEPNETPPPLMEIPKPPEIDRPETVGDTVDPADYLPPDVESRANAAPVASEPSTPGDNDQGDDIAAHLDDLFGGGADEVTEATPEPEAPAAAAASQPQEMPTATVTPPTASAQTPEPQTSVAAPAKVAQPRSAPQTPSTADATARERATSQTAAAVPTRSEPEAASFRPARAQTNRGPNRGVLIAAGFGFVLFAGAALFFMFGGGGGDADGETNQASLSVPAAPTASVAAVSTPVTTPPVDASEEPAEPTVEESVEPIRLAQAITPKVESPKPEPKPEPKPVQPASKPEPEPKAVDPEPVRVARATPPPAIPEPVAKPAPKPAPKPVVAEVTPKPAPKPEPLPAPPVVAQNRMPREPQPAPVVAPRPKVEATPVKPAAPVVNAPVLVDRVEATYRTKALRKGETVRIVLRVLISESGHISRVVVDQGAPGSELEAAAMNAVLRWRYEPGTEDGVPVKAWTEALFEFSR